MDFGRQPQPVNVTIEGEPEDVAYWTRELARRSEFKGDMVQRANGISLRRTDSFKIFPRAVND